MLSTTFLQKEGITHCPLAKKCAKILHISSRRLNLVSLLLGRWPRWTLQRKCCLFSLFKRGEKRQKMAPVFILGCQKLLIDVSRHGGETAGVSLRRGKFQMDEEGNR